MFGRFFRKDYRALQEKGEQLFSDGRFADARLTFADAMEVCEATPGIPEEVRAAVRHRFVEAGNRLAHLNLEEAEHAIRAGHPHKAEEHVVLALELGEDGVIGEYAAKLRNSMKHGLGETAKDECSSSCSGCSPSPIMPSEAGEKTLMDMDERERFELMIQILPGDLKERYATLGEEFASAYLLAHDGFEEAASVSYSNLLNRGENDVLLYELAVLRYRLENPGAAEDLLRRALVINPVNPLCSLSLAQLLIETGRATEAMPVLTGMLDNGILVEAAGIMLGDLHQFIGNEQQAIDIYTRLLQSGIATRTAAERLVPLLDGAGHEQEANHLRKTYLKGCC